MEKVKEVMNFLLSKKNYMALLVVFLAVVVAIAAAKMYVIPIHKKYANISEEISSNKTTLEGLQDKKKAQDLAEKNSLIKIDDVPTKIYRNTQPGVPVETTSINFVSTVIQMLEQTGNNILDISYKVDAADANEKSLIPTNVAVVQLTLTLNSRYDNFQRFMNALYDYDYLATIKSFKMTPLIENKNIVEIKVILWLYIAK